MAAKFVLVAVLVASVSASGEYSSFSYGVSDPNTGDIKDQQENRVGGNVVGKYSLLESDGTKRVVEYSADDATGFKAVVHKEPAAGAVGATGAIGNLHSHPAHLAHAGANPIGHHGPLAAVSSLNHVAQLGAASSLSHGAVPATSHAAHAAAAHAAATHAAKVAHANKVAQAAHAAAPLASAVSPVSSLTHPAALAAGVPLAHAAPISPLAAASPLAHGIYGNNLAVNAPHLAGHPGSFNAGYGNPLVDPLNFANRGAPTVSSYSHTIVHNGPDAFPNGGAYGRYGAHSHSGFGPYGTGLAGSAFAQGNPWASGAALAQSNPWAPSPALAHGPLASPHAALTGSRLGW